MLHYYYSNDNIFDNWPFSLVLASLDVFWLFHKFLVVLAALMQLSVGNFDDGILFWRELRQIDSVLTMDAFGASDETQEDGEDERDADQDGPNEKVAASASLVVAPAGGEILLVVDHFIVQSSEGDLLVDLVRESFKTVFRSRSFFLRGAVAFVLDLHIDDFVVVVDVTVELLARHFHEVLEVDFLLLFLRTLATLFADLLRLFQLDQLWLNVRLLESVSNSLGELGEESAHESLEVVVSGFGGEFVLLDAFQLEVRVSLRRPRVAPITNGVLGSATFFLHVELSSTGRTFLACISID